MTVLHDRLPLLHLDGSLVDPVRFTEHLVGVDERVFWAGVLFWEKVLYRVWTRAAINSP